MLYLGFFNYFDQSDPNDIRYCHFSAMVTAENPDAAVGSFEHLFRKSKEENAVLDGVSEIYFDSFIELAGVSSADAIAQWKGVKIGKVGSYSSISMAYPHYRGDDVNAYYWESDAQKGNSPAPFVTF